MKYVSNAYFFEDLKERLKKDIDIIIDEDKELGLTLIFQEQTCDIVTFSKQLLPQLRSYPDLAISEVLVGLAREVDIEKKDVYQIIFNGLMLVYDHRREKFFLVDISKSLRRSTSDSSVEPDSIIGARDGFTENYKDNISLLRHRLKNSNVLIDEFKIGKRSKTWVGLMYISDIQNESMRQAIVQKLNSIEIDALLSINDLLPWLSKRQILPICNYFGSPDLAANRLLDGQFLLLIDRIPVVLSLPTNLLDLTEESIDLIDNKPLHFFQRLLVIFCLFLSTVFLGLFICFVTFQSDALSLPILSTLAVTQKGAVFPICVEIMFVLFLFEMYYLVGFRSSEKTLSSTIVLIGGLLIGQNLIESGLVGVLIITVTALCFLAGFVVSNNLHFIFGISIIRLIFLFSALFFGIFGLTLALILICTYFSKQSFLGEHVLYPFVPFDWQGFRNFFYARSSRKRRVRNLSLGLKDETNKGE